MKTSRTALVLAALAVVLTGCAQAETESDTVSPEARNSVRAAIDPENCAVEFEETTENGDPKFITLQCADSRTTLESDQNRPKSRIGEMDGTGVDWRVVELNSAEHTEGKKWTVVYEGSIAKDVDMRCEASAFAFHSTTNVVCDENGERTERITSSDPSSDLYPATQS